jgi:hypothetical protein
MFRSVWPVEDRPEEMQVEEWFNQMTTDYIFSMKRIWDEKKKKDDKGEETFKRDAALPTRQYDGGPDNCTDLLHPARYDLNETGFSIKAQYGTRLYGWSGAGSANILHRIRIKSGSGILV